MVRATGTNRARAAALEDVPGVGGGHFPFAGAGQHGARGAHDGLADGGTPRAIRRHRDRRDDLAGHAQGRPVALAVAVRQADLTTWRTDHLTGTCRLDDVPCLSCVGLMVIAPRVGCRNYGKTPRDGKSSAETAAIAAATQWSGCKSERSTCAGERRGWIVWQLGVYRN